LHREANVPRWSNEILDELRRTLLEKLGRSPEQVDHLLNELNRHFADARVEGFETLVALMTNDPGDRHVMAAAVKCGAEATVTFNLRHFPDAALDTWNIEVQHPDGTKVAVFFVYPLACPGKTA
jgi:predicted nucleic acid-binding protein